MKKLYCTVVFSLWLAASIAASFHQFKDPAPVNQVTIDQTILKLKEKHGSQHQFRIERGVKQIASVWQVSDGDDEAFSAFAMDHFIADKAELDLLFDRCANNFEYLFGYLDRISLELNRQTVEDRGPVHKIDQYFSAYSPSAHVQEDLFQNKIAFIVALNFPNYTLEEKNQLGLSWNDRQWGYARLGDLFTTRIPPEINQQLSKVASEVDLYISEYNIFAGQLIDKNGKKLFPEKMKLLAHWNIRDEIKSNYARVEGLPKQEMLYQVMLRIIDQTIPEQVINNPGYQWDPVTNKLYQNEKSVTVSPEGLTRYEHLLKYFHTMRLFDPYYPGMDTYVKRTFEAGMEMPKDEVIRLFKEYVSSPLVRETGQLIRERLGRPLQPFDIWYDGFTARSSIPEEKLDQLTKKLYPDARSVDAALPRILEKLGFDLSTSAFLAENIDVDAARGSGHAAPSYMKEMPSHLRTRVGKDGMDYKGYNIAMHELGHNVEQTFSLHSVNNYLLRGVPNNAFTEALAMMFQARDLHILDIQTNDPEKASLDVLDILWDNYEIMGVSLVDMEVWDWLYANPDASAEELKNAVIAISKDVWNKYYADVFGVKDVPVLSIYSHMISYPLYLMSYPYGRLVMFQLEDHYKGKDFGTETKRIFSIGKKTPSQWMIEASGEKIGNQAIFEAAKTALKTIRQNKK